MPDGGSIAVGRFEGKLAAGSLAGSGAGDGFVLALTSAGAVTWGAALGGAGDQDLTAVAVGESLAVAGSSTGPAVLGGRSIEAAGQPGAIAARLDRGGAPVWMRGFASTDYAVPAALVWTGGDLVVAGYFAGTLDPSGAALHAVGGMDVWVARLAGSDGRVLWIHRAGGPGTDAIHAIAAAGDVAIVAGSFQRWADFSSSTLRGEDESADPFVAAVGPDGFRWAHSFPTDGSGVAHGIAAVAGAGLAVAITFDGAIFLGESRVEAGTISRGAVAMLRDGGEVAWSRLIDGSRSADVVASAGDRILVAGASGASEESSSPESRGYVATFSAAGAPLGNAATTGLPAALAATDGAVVGGSGFVAHLPMR